MGNRVARVKSVGRLRALVRYFKDPKASIFGKLFVLAAVFYVIWPMDLIPDVPIVGWLDDLGVLGIASAWLLRRLAPYREAPALPEAPPADVIDVQAGGDRPSIRNFHSGAVFHSGGFSIPELSIPEGAEIPVRNA